MNYAELFRMTLPETALEIAALLVLVVDLGLLRKAALQVRVAVAALLGVFGCGAAVLALRISDAGRPQLSGERRPASRGGRIVGGSASRNPGAHGADACSC